MIVLIQINMYNFIFHVSTKEYPPETKDVECTAHVVFPRSKRIGKIIKTKKNYYINYIAKLCQKPQGRRGSGNALKVI